MDIELAIDMLEMAEHIDHAILFSGDGDFRRLVEAVQRRGVRVSVVSTIRSSPPMVSDDLRRQADNFIELQELAPSIMRNHHPRDETAAPRRGARAGRDRQTCRAVDAAADGACSRRRCRRATARSARGSRPSARRSARRIPTGSTRRCRRSATPTPELLIVGLAPGLRGANRTGRPFTGDYAGDLLYRTLLEVRLRRPGNYGAACRRRARTAPRPHHQRGALRAAAEQAGTGRDRGLRPVSRGRDRRACRGSRRSWRSAPSRTTRARAPRA